MREREARLLEAILANTASHMAYLDPDFNFLRVNAAYVNGCGHTEAELIGRNHFDLFPDAENQAIFARVRDTGERAEFVEKPFEYADQPERGVTYWNWRLSPVKNAAGAVEGLVLSLTDVTDQVRTRERLVAAERARAQLAETLAAEVSHRMKNNLAMAAGVLQVQIADQPEDSPAAGLLRAAISRLRTFAIVHERLQIDARGDVDLSYALRRVAEIGGSVWSAEAVALSMEGDSLRYPSPVATTLCVVANELVTNAIKYGAPGPDGRRQIRIVVALQAGRLHLSVWNSGAAVSSDFDPTRQSGIGLRLVHGIVAGQYGGSFNLRPHDGGTLAEVIVDDAKLRQAG
jgi:PAS domain S-box-containing protein